MKIRSKKERINLLRKLVRSYAGRVEIDSWWRLELIGRINPQLYEMIRYSPHELAADITRLRKEGFIVKEKTQVGGRMIVFYKAVAR